MGRHPLEQEPEWFFEQRTVQVHAPIYRVVNDFNKGPLKNRKMVIAGQDVCREGVIHGVRRKLGEALGFVRNDEHCFWRKSFVLHSSPDMNHESLKQPGLSWVAVKGTHISGYRMGPNPHYGKRPKWEYGSDSHHVRKPFVRSEGATVLSDEDVDNYLRLCDAVVGPITVLLNPDRYTGNWWRTEVGDSMQRDGFLRWYGIDNTALWHPALVSLYTGLVRQCAFMARTGVVDQVLSDVEGLGLEECLTESDESLALEIMKKMEKWIAVPRPKSGGVENIPIPRGTLNKITSLHKALYNHGFSKTFGRSMLAGWNVANPYGNEGQRKNPNYRGIHSFMGRSGTSGRGKAIKKLSLVSG